MKKNFVLGNISWHPSQQNYLTLQNVLGKTTSANPSQSRSPLICTHWLCRLTNHSGMLTNPLKCLPVSKQWPYSLEKWPATVCALPTQSLHISNAKAYSWTAAENTVSSKALGISLQNFIQGQARMLEYFWPQWSINRQSTNSSANCPNITSS